MNILMLGGTRFFGKHAVRALLSRGHEVTIGTRGQTSDEFGDRVRRIALDRHDPQSLRRNLSDRHFDAIVDNLCYCSNDVKYLLDAADCDRYVMTSTTAVYDKHWHTAESEFDPLQKPLVWCDRPAFPYDEVKRQAECALFQRYPQVPSVAARFPFVIGPDDYTQRLRFYVTHALHGVPMHVDNAGRQMGFVRSDEAGALLAFLAESDFHGAVNGSSPQTISIREVLDYVREQTGCAAILSDDGEAAPYNGENEYSIDISRAEELGFRFTPLKEWIYDLLDRYIAEGR